MSHSHDLTVGRRSASASPPRLGAAPATASRRHPAPRPSATPRGYAAYDGSQREGRRTGPSSRPCMKSVAEKRAANPGAAAVTVTYNARSAPELPQPDSQQRPDLEQLGVERQAPGGLERRLHATTRATTRAARTRAPTATAAATSSSTTAQNQQYNSDPRHRPRDRARAGPAGPLLGPVQRADVGRRPRHLLHQRLPEHHRALPGELASGRTASQPRSPAPPPDAASSRSRQAPLPGRPPTGPSQSCSTAAAEPPGTAARGRSSSGAAPCGGRSRPPGPASASGGLEREGTPVPRSRAVRRTRFELPAAPYLLDESGAPVPELRDVLPVRHIAVGVLRATEAGETSGESRGPGPGSSRRTRRRCTSADAKSGGRTR